MTAQSNASIRSNETSLAEAFTDSTMLGLIARYGELRLKCRPPFVVLSRSIIAQQISTKAADTIRSRFVERFGLSSSAVGNTTLISLRELGISEGKALCLQDVAARVTKGEFDEFDSLSDDAVVGRLRAIKGIGQWTAQMFLIFSLARPDVWPLTDAGLRVAAIRLYGANSSPAINELGSRFAPRRSVAALYLWKSLENCGSNP